MKYIQYTTQELAEPTREKLNDLLGYDDGHGTKQATGPAVEGADGLFYLTVREQWLSLLDEANYSYPTVVDSFERPAIEADLT